TASLMYPEKQLGSVFWTRVRQKLQQKYGTTDIPVNTFNKVWIVPDQAVVYEHDRSAFVVQSHLKVMLEQDYLALDHHINEPEKELAIALDVEGDSLEKSSEVASEMVREVLIPEIEREVNEGENFTALRQIYQSMILASWFKDNLKETLLGKVYMNQVKTRGIETDDEEINQRIYQRYLEAFEAGVYNYIKEEMDPDTQEMIPRKYFSGGITTMNVGTVRRDLATLPRTEQERILTAASQQSPRAQILDIEVDFLGLGAEAGDLVINTVKKANERGVPIIIPATDQASGVRSDKAVLSEAQKIAAIKGYRIDSQEFLAADAENADDIAGAIKDINAEAAKGKFTEVQTLLNYLKFGPFTEEAKALAVGEGEKVDRLLSGQKDPAETAAAAAAEEGKPARKTKVLYRLTLDWKKNISSEERILLNQIDSAIREDDLYLVETLLNRLRNIGTLSTPRREQVIQEIARVNLYRFNQALTSRGRPKPVVFAEKNYPKFLKAVTAAEDRLGLSQYVAKGDYNGAISA
ncbi:MAG: hypothetical protein K8I00_06870, partial [Candidatus Omnitrophica bacterium]|nr:hypothetical protein [Candidatus Omnitrophota bacterium]